VTPGATACAAAVSTPASEPEALARLIAATFAPPASTPATTHVASVDSAAGAASVHADAPAGRYAVPGDMAGVQGASESRLLPLSDAGAGAVAAALPAACELAVTSPAGLASGADGQPPGSAFHVSPMAQLVSAVVQPAAAQSWPLRQASSAAHHATPVASTALVGCSSCDAPASAASLPRLPYVETATASLRRLIASAFSANVRATTAAGAPRTGLPAATRCSLPASTVGGCRACLSAVVQLHGNTVMSVGAAQHSVPF
jgi:hypothetical protein